jgi:hypothetical protein
MHTQLRLTNGRGFHLNFPNGVTLSVQIGAGNYADNYNHSFSDEGPLPPSGLAEIAVWPTSGDMVNINGDSVAGYVPIEDVLSMVPMLSALPNGATATQIEDCVAVALKAS